MIDIPKINNIYSDRPKALIAPLDWGLGHATRCVPIINDLLTAGWEVIIASDGRQQQLLQAEFPGLQFVRLPGYALKYAGSRQKTILKIISQIPKILIKIKSENRWLRAFLRENPVRAVFSDNRYGLNSKKCVSIIITHQLHIVTPFGKRFDAWLQFLHYRLLEKFSICWVPDYEDLHHSLAGALSHPAHLPSMDTRYIGGITRLKAVPGPHENDLLILLSGPEPQRTILEKKIFDSLAFEGCKAVVVRGLPGKTVKKQLSDHVIIYDHLPAAELNKLFNDSEFIMARSGYTTVMDALLLKKKTILIPTPGQTEQEWLADYLMSNKWAFSVKQDRFSLRPALEQARQFSYISFEEPVHSSLSQAIAALPY